MLFCLFGNSTVTIEYEFSSCTLNEDSDFICDNFKSQYTISVNHFIRDIVYHLSNDNLVNFTVDVDSFVFNEFNVNTGETFDFSYKILLLNDCFDKELKNEKIKY